MRSKDIKVGESYGTSSVGARRYDTTAALLATKVTILEDLGGGKWSAHYDRRGFTGELRSADLLDTWENIEAVRERLRQQEEAKAKAHAEAVDTLTALLPDGFIEEARGHGQRWAYVGPASTATITTVELARIVQAAYREGVAAREVAASD